MRYEEVDYGGEKIKVKVFDYHTPEGWHEYVMNTYGSVDDETLTQTSAFFTCAGL